MTHSTYEYGETDWLEREITTNMTDTSVSTAETRLRAGRAEMAIRRRGAAITRLALVDNRGELADILYADPDHRKPKLIATHAMMPVGKNDGLGGQHGIPRWLDYYAAKTEGDAYRVANTLTAVVGDSPLHIERNSVLVPNKAQTTVQVTNGGSEPLNTSLGEHLYFAMPEGATAHDVLINNRTIDALTEPGVTGYIAKGKPYLWRGYQGSAQIEVADAYSVFLDAHATGNSLATDTAPVGLLLWQRPSHAGEHQPSICIEPVVGYTESNNRQLTIAPYNGYAALSTTITTAQ